MSKITRQSYKRKKIVMGFALFGAIGLVSTGFAAWVLSSRATTNKEATMQVGTVTQNSMEFSAVTIYETGDPDKTALDPATFSFEPAESDHTGRVRTDGTSQERLSLTASTTLSQAQNLGTLVAKVALEDVGSTDFQEAVSKKYIVLPTAEFVIYDAVTNPSAPAINGDITITGESTKSAAITYEVAFEWGDFFGGLNPSVYFDSDTLGGADGNVKGEEVADADVATILTELHDLLDGVKVTLTLEADPN